MVLPLLGLLAAGYAGKELLDPYLENRAANVEARGNRERFAEAGMGRFMDPETGGLLAGTRQEDYNAAQQFGGLLDPGEIAMPFGLNDQDFGHRQALQRQADAAAMARIGAQGAQTRANAAAAHERAIALEDYKRANAPPPPEPDPFPGAPTGWGADLSEDFMGLERQDAQLTTMLDTARAMKAADISDGERRRLAGDLDRQANEWARAAATVGGAEPSDVAVSAYRDRIGLPKGFMMRAQPGDSLELFDRSVGGMRNELLQRATMLGQTYFDYTGGMLPGYDRFQARGARGGPREGGAGDWEVIE